MTKDEQDLAMMIDANHAHPAPTAPTGTLPPTGKFRRAALAAQYASTAPRPRIDMDFAEKARQATKLGETYDEAADRALQAKNLEKLKAYKLKRTRELSSAIQERFNTPLEYILRSREIRAEQDRLKKKKKLALQLERAAKNAKPFNTIIQLIPAAKPDKPARDLALIA